MNCLLELFRPDQYARAVSEIDVDALAAEGYQCLVLDLDNTLVPWKSTDIPVSSKDWVERAKRAGLKMCIVSNTHNPRRLQSIAGQLGVPWIARALKPRLGGFARAAKMLGSPPERGVVVGDQVLTDILGGNLARMHTILVRPMQTHEFIGTRLNRFVERAILALVSRAQAREQSQTITSQKERDSK